MTSKWTMLSYGVLCVVAFPAQLAIAETPSAQSLVHTPQSNPQAVATIESRLNVELPPGASLVLGPNGQPLQAENGNFVVMTREQRAPQKAQQHSLPQGSSYIQGLNGFVLDPNGSPIVVSHAEREALQNNKTTLQGILEARHQQPVRTSQEPPVVTAGSSNPVSTASYQTAGAAAMGGAAASLGSSFVDPQIQTGAGPQSGGFLQALDRTLTGVGTILNMISRWRGPFSSGFGGWGSGGFGGWGGRGFGGYG